MCSQNEAISQVKEMAVKFWEYIEDRAREKPANVIFNIDKKEAFVESYIKDYDKIIHKYMRKDTTSLDSHKCAALFIIQCLKNKVFTTIEDTNDKSSTINIYPQIVAIDIAFAFMLKCLNEALNKKNLRKKIKKYILPMPYSCDRPYVEVMSRILYYEGKENDMQLSYNYFELSDRLFLIEYLTLLQCGIEPLILRDE